MTDDRNSPPPSPIRWLIGSALRDARVAAKVSQRAAGQVLRVSHVTISNMESGKVTQEPAKITELLKYYGCDVAMTDRLARLAGSYADSATWWADYSDVVPDWFNTFVGLTDLAHRQFVYDPQVLPGMTQTAGYAQALLVNHPQYAAIDAPQIVNLRMARQERRLLGTNPLHFTAVIEETTLYRMVGGPDVMRLQLEHLLDLDQRDNVDLYVMPHAHAVHPGLDGEFMMLDFREAQSIVYSEFQDGAVYVQQAERVAKYSVLRDLLIDAASPARELIELYLSRLR
jgi:transcriptional regulator with XRE-family HTH domain